MSLLRCMHGSVVPGRPGVAVVRAAPAPCTFRLQREVSGFRSRVRIAQVTQCAAERRARRPGRSTSGRRPAQSGRAAQRSGPRTTRADGRQRLAKVMAEAGVAARRKCEDIVIAGRVKVNGEICYVPQTMVKAPPDRIEVDGKLLSGSMPSKLYFMVNKPKGYICSSVAGDTEAGKRAVDMLEPFFKRWKQGKPADARIPRVFTVGRLDVASQGLLLISNDGGWAHQITHPSGGVTKEYVVRLNKPPSKGELRALAAGCEIDGHMVVPEFVALAGSDPNSADRVRIVVMEGRNREVRRIVEAAGMDVVTLKRVRIGGLQLPKDLGLGGFRQLKPNEVKLVLDKGAQNNAIFNRLRLASGR